MVSRSRMQGAVAIEFALVFVLFIALLYAIVSYAVVFMLVQSFTYASEDGLRAAIAVDCAGLSTNDCFEDEIKPAVRAQVVESLSWLPAGLSANVLGTNGDRVAVTIQNDDTCEAVISYDYAADPLIPVLNLPVIGAVPRLPATLIGRARLRI